MVLVLKERAFQCTTYFASMFVVLLSPPNNLSLTFLSSRLYYTKFNTLFQSFSKSSLIFFCKILSLNTHVSSKTSKAELICAYQSSFLWWDAFLCCLNNQFSFVTVNRYFQMLPAHVNSYLGTWKRVLLMQECEGH